MSPEEGGSWFFLSIELSAEKGLILDKEAASALEAEGILEKLSADGVSVIKNEVGAWQAFAFSEDFMPYSIPPSIRLIAPYTKIGTVITLDNGCMPSVEWRFKEKGIEVFDSYGFTSK
ncbi:hypothetical protein [Gallaecimonas xiamenensis]|uniref:hypothetical protein n=1 Tax=Gallaecimonas xiamenensis TaxID=1207039 RepID=UPI0012EA8BB6|nr:hypothetical protein [Gallaecimonas xiamenensis]